MNFKNFIPAVLAILGIQDFHEEEGRKVLTAQEKQKLATAGFPAKFADDFEAALNEPETSASNDEADRRVAALTAVLGQTTAQLTTANQELAALKAKSNTDAEQIAAKEATIKELNSKVATLSELAEPDNAANASTGAASGQTFDIANEQQLGGMNADSRFLIRSIAPNNEINSFWFCSPTIRGSDSGNLVVSSSIICT